MIIGQTVRIQLTVHVGIEGGTIRTPFSVLPTDTLFDVKMEIFKKTTIPPFRLRLSRKGYEAVQSPHSMMATIAGGSRSIVLLFLETNEKEFQRKKIELYYSTNPELLDFLQHTNKNNRSTLSTNSNKPNYSFNTEAIKDLVNAEDCGPLILIFRFLSPLYLLSSISSVCVGFHSTVAKFFRSPYYNRSWNASIHLPLTCGMINYVSESYLRKIISFTPFETETSIINIKIPHFGVGISVAEYCIVRKFYTLFFEFVSRYDWKEVFNFGTLHSAVLSRNEQVIEFVLSVLKDKYILHPPTRIELDLRTLENFWGGAIVYDYLLENQKWEFIDRQIELHREKRIEVLELPYFERPSFFGSNVIMEYVCNNMTRLMSKIDLPFSRFRNINRLDPYPLTTFLTHVTRHIESLPWTFLSEFITKKYSENGEHEIDITHDRFPFLYLSKFITSLREKRFEEFGKFVIDQVSRRYEEECWLMELLYPPRILIEYFASIGDGRSVKKILGLETSEKNDEDEDSNGKSPSKITEQDIGVVYERNRDSHRKDYIGSERTIPLRFMFEKVAHNDDLIRILLSRFELTPETLSKCEQDVIFENFDFVDLVQNGHEFATDQYLCEIVRIICSRGLTDPPKDLLIKEPEEKDEKEEDREVIIMKNEELASEIFKKIEIAKPSIHWNRDLIMVTLKLGIDRITELLLSRRENDIDVVTYEMIETATKNSRNRFIPQLLKFKISSNVITKEEDQFEMFQRLFEFAFKYESKSLYDEVQKYELYDRKMMVLALIHPLIRKEERTKFLKCFREWEDENVEEKYWFCCKKCDEIVFVCRDDSVSSFKVFMDMKIGLFGFPPLSDEESDFDDDDDEEEKEDEKKDRFHVVCCNCTTDD